MHKHHNHQHLFPVDQHISIDTKYIIKSLKVGDNICYTYKDGIPVHRMQLSAIIKFREVMNCHVVAFAIYFSRRVYSASFGLHRFMMRLLDLYLIIMQGNLVFIQWLQARGLLKDSMRCTQRGCRGVMQRKTRAACQDGYHWVSTRTRCKKTKSLRIGSFSTKSHLSLWDIMCLVYCWSVGMTMSTTSTTLGIPKQTVINFYNFIREEYSAKLLKLPVEDMMLGGEGQILEIDESLMIKRKYNRGRQRQQHNEWVFGMYDHQARKGKIKFLRRRDEGTLIPIVNEFVRPGTTVHSDGWAAYNHLGEHGYTYRVVVNEENFVDPITGAHT